MVIERAAGTAATFWTRRTHKRPIKSFFSSQYLFLFNFHTSIQLPSQVRVIWINVEQQRPARGRWETKKGLTVAHTAGEPPGGGGRPAACRPVCRFGRTDLVYRTSQPDLSVLLMTDGPTLAEKGCSSAVMIQEEGAGEGEGLHSFDISFHYVRGSPVWLML